MNHGSDIAPNLVFVEIPDPWLDIRVTAGRDAPAPITRIDIPAILAQFEKWLTLDVADGAPSPLTIAAYTCDVRAHLAWLIDQGYLTVGHVTLDTLKLYRAQLVHGDATHRPFAVTTVRRKLASLRRFYGLARGHAALPADPSIGLKSPRDRTGRADRIKYLELHDLGRLIAATGAARTPQIAIRDRAILTLMAYHGLRRCEIRRLDLADVDLAAGETGQLDVLGKGDKRRLVPLVDETAEDLRRWLAVRKLARHVSCDSSGDEALFVQLHWNAAPGTTGRLSDRAINAIVDTYLRATGLKKRGVSCHTLRHTCATQALAHGGNLLAIGDTLGHSSIDTTRIYAKIVDRNLNNPARVLSGKI